MQLYTIFKGTYVLPQYTNNYQLSELADKVIGDKLEPESTEIITSLVEPQELFQNFFNIVHQNEEFIGNSANSFGLQVQAIVLWDDIQNCCVGFAAHQIQNGVDSNTYIHYITK